MEIEIENNDIICDGKRIRDGYRELKKEAFDKVGKFVIFYGVWELNEEEIEEYIENRLEDFIAKYINEHMVHYRDIPNVLFKGLR